MSSFHYLSASSSVISSYSSMSSDSSFSPSYKIKWKLRMTWSQNIQFTQLTTAKIFTVWSYCCLKKQFQLQKIEKKFLVRGNQKEGWMIEIDVTVNLQQASIYFRIGKLTITSAKLSLTTSMIFGATSPSNHLMQYVSSSFNFQPNDVGICGVGSIPSEFVEILAT